MRKNVWVLLVVGVLACGVLVVGCGDDDETSATAVTVEDTDAVTTETGGETSVTADETSSDSASADDVYNACVDAIEGTAAESAGQTACEQARDAFEQCATQADNVGGSAGETALGICQQAADQAVKSLESAGSAG